MYEQNDNKRAIILSNMNVKGGEEEPLLSPLYLFGLHTITVASMSFGSLYLYVCVCVVPVPPFT